MLPIRSWIHGWREGGQGLDRAAVFTFILLITGIGGFVTVYEMGVNGIAVSTMDPISEISLSIILVFCRTTMQASPGLPARRVWILQTEHRSRH
jgi:hypothetical protein